MTESLAGRFAAFRARCRIFTICLTIGVVGYILFAANVAVMVAVAVSIGAVLNSLAAAIVAKVVVIVRAVAVLTLSNFASVVTDVVMVIVFVTGCGNYAGLVFVAGVVIAGADAFFFAVVFTAVFNAYKPITENVLMLVIDFDFSALFVGANGSFFKIAVIENEFFAFHKSEIGVTESIGNCFESKGQHNSVDFSRFGIVPKNNDFTGIYRKFFGNNAVNDYILFECRRNRIAHKLEFCCIILEYELKCGNSAYVFRNDLNGTDLTFFSEGGGIEFDCCSFSTHCDDGAGKNHHHSKNKCNKLFHTFTSCKSFCICKFHRELVD